MMRVFLSCVLGLAAVVSGLPSQYEDGAILGRAASDKCSAPEGTGTCQNTSNCKGISYSAGLCPNDPNDVQCCVEISCSVPSVGSGYCRSVKNNGCPGGSFNPGNHCPGDNDIVCCVKNGVAPPAPAPRSAPVPDPCSTAAYNKLMFEDSISTFGAAKDAKSPSCFDWSDDNCTCAPDRPSGFDFIPSCHRHDFGYRNAKKYNLFDDALREKVDANFKDDLYDMCNQYDGWKSLEGIECRRLADIYVGFVRKFGKKKRRDASGTLQKRECDIPGIPII